MQSSGGLECTAALVCRGVTVTVEGDKGQTETSRGKRPTPTPTPTLHSGFLCRSVPGRGGLPSEGHSRFCQTELG